jgi:outer membrane protein TolC
MYLIICALISTAATATFQPMWKGYQISNLNKSIVLQKNISEAEYKFKENMNDWKFIFSPSYRESNLASLFAFQAQNTKTNTYAFEFTKSSFDYGNVTIRHTKTDYDISDWNSTALSSFTDDHLFENRTGIEYSYDFLDRSSSDDLSIIIAEANANESANQLDVEKGYLSFFQTYLQAKYQIYAVELSKSFVGEAKKRVNRTKKRRKDGLSRNVELLQSQSSLLNQEEAVETSRSALKENLSIIENILKIKITENYFSDISWIPRPFSFWKKTIKEQEHLSVIAAKSRVEVSRQNLSKLKNQNGVKLLFTAGLTTNAINENDTNSFNEHLDTVNKNVGFGLNLVIPLGLDKRSALNSRVLLENKKNELSILNLEDEIKVQKDALLSQIRYFEKINSISSRKVEIAKKTLKEQNRYYLNAQTTFEEVIRAEENYINTKLSEKRNLLNYELLVANYAYLNNSIESFLNAYRD